MQILGLRSLFLGTLLVFTFNVKSFANIYLHNALYTSMNHFYKIENIITYMQQHPEKYSDLAPLIQERKDRFSKLKTLFKKYKLKLPQANQYAQNFTTPKEMCSYASLQEMQNMNNINFLIPKIKYRPVRKLLKEIVVSTRDVYLPLLQDCQF